MVKRILGVVGGLFVGGFAITMLSTEPEVQRTTSPGFSSVLGEGPGPGFSIDVNADGVNRWIPGDGNSPIYFTMTQTQLYPWSEMPAGHYDSLATMDVVQWHMMLFDEDETPAFENYTSELRERNPDIMVVDYFYAWGIEDGWVDADSTYTAGNIRHDWWTFIDDHNYYTHDASGNNVQAHPESSNAWLINMFFKPLGSSARIDSCAQFIADYINASGNSQEYTGIYFDYWNYPDISNWPCLDNPVCRDLIDLNENGTVYNDEQLVEQLVFTDGYKEFVAKLRTLIDHDKFIITSNGNSHYNDSAYAAIVEGGKYELVDTASPDTYAEWEHAILYGSDSFNQDVLSKPLVYMDKLGTEDANDEVRLVVYGLICNSAISLNHKNAAGYIRRYWSLPESLIGGRVNLGAAIPGGVSYAASAETDTAYRQFEKGYVKMVPDFSGSPHWDFEYIIVDSIAPGIVDTLFISDTWPDAHRPSVPTGLVATGGDAQVSLDWDDNSDYFSPITFSVYRGTTSGILSLLESDLTDSDHIDTTVSNGIEYFYAIHAFYYTEVSGRSSEDSATPAK